MKAVVIKQFGSPVSIHEVQTPTLGPEEVLVRVRSCGLCGTDLKIVSGKFSDLRLPLVPGHEISGEICEAGNGVTEVSVGDRVVVYIYVGCGQCRYCHSGRENLCENLRGHVGFTIDGGLAEYVRVPARNVLRFAKTISFPHAALLPDAVSTPYHALRKQAKLQKEDVLVVVGVGGLGLHAVQIAKAMGARVFAVDIKDRHLEKAAECGADVLLHPDRDNIDQAIQKESGRGGADVVMDLVGLPETQEKGVEWLCSGGRLLLVGYNLGHPLFSVSTIKMARKEVEILGCRAMTRQDLAEAIRWTEEKKIVPVVDEVLPLTEINEAYDRLARGKVMGRLVLEV